MAWLAVAILLVLVVAVVAGTKKLLAARKRPMPELLSFAPKSEAVPEPEVPDLSMHPHADDERPGPVDPPPDRLLPAASEEQ